MKMRNYVIVGLIVLGAGLPLHRAVSAPIGISACQTIAASGSYILTNNITANGDCLILSADHVTIDLDGYVIVGNGTGSGIKGGGGLRKGIAVRNGTIRNFVNGMFFSSDGLLVLVDRMRFIDNSSIGVSVNEAASVKDSLVTGSSLGMAIGSRSIVTGNIAKGNKDGFNVGPGSVVIENMAGVNTRDGFQLHSGTIVANNTSQVNARYGFSIDCASNLQGNAAIGNGTNFKLNTSAGTCIQAHNLAP